jgi:hypothetical protein
MIKLLLPASQALGLPGQQQQRNQQRQQDQQSQ